MEDSAKDYGIWCGLFAPMIGIGTSARRSGLEHLGSAGGLHWDEAVVYHDRKARGVVHCGHDHFSLHIHLQIQLPNTMKPLTLLLLNGGLTSAHCMSLPPSLPHPKCTHPLTILHRGEQHLYLQQQNHHALRIHPRRLPHPLHPLLPNLRSKYEPRLRRSHLRPQRVARVGASQGGERESGR